MSAVKAPIKFTFLIILISIISVATHADVISDTTLSDIKEPASTYSSSAPTLLNMSVKTVIEGGNCIVDDYKGCTFNDVLNDINSDDDFKPEVKVQFTADDFADDGLPTNAKIRQRGGHTRFLPLKSFRIKLDSKKDLWRNERRIQLVKSFDDATRIRNKLSYDLFAKIPHLPSMRTQFVNLKIDNATNPAPNTGANTGPNLGLFTHIEHVGKEYIKNRGWEKDSRAYKAEHFTFSEDPIALALDIDGKPIDEKKFEYILEIKSGKDHQKLNEMLAIVNDKSLDFQTDIFNKYFDKDNYLTWYAINILVNNADTSNHNFYLYNPKSSDKFYFIPWDYDYAWGAQLDGTDGLTPNHMPPWWYSHAYRWDDNLHKQFLQKEGNIDLLKQAVTEIKNKYLTREQIKAKLDAYRGLTMPLVTEAPDDYWGVYGGDPEKVANYNKVLDKLINNIELNYGRFISSFNNPMPFYSYAPEISFNATATSTEAVRFDWDDTVSLQGQTISYDIVIYSSKTVTIIDPSPGTPAQRVVPDKVVEIKTGIQESHYLLNWAHKTGSYYYKVIARDSSKPSELWQISYDEAVKDVNGFPIHGVVKFDISKDGLGTLPVVTNVVPVAISQSVSPIRKNTSIELTLIANDVVENNKLSLTITAQPSHGKLTFIPSSMVVSYEANTDFTGQDSFKFKVNDGLSDSNEATINLLINEPPVATDRTVAATQKNKVVDIDLTGNVSDVGGDKLSLIISQQPSNGTLSTGAGLVVKYTPKKDFSGEDSFKFRAKDINSLYSNEATVSLTIINQAPTSKDIAFSTTRNTTVDITLTGIDTDNDPLTLIVTKQPAHGKLVLGAGLSVKYSPNSSYTGSDLFKYKVNDGLIDSNEATVQLTIEADTSNSGGGGGGSTSWLFLLLGFIVILFKDKRLKLSRYAR